MLLDHAETDWLGSKPVFYNEKTGKISYSIWDVIEIDKVEFHPEGFQNYLMYGYSVFGQTPILNVKFLRYAASIKKIDGKLIVSEGQDPCERLLGKESNPEEVLLNIRENVEKWANKQDKIILPLSGGYDSKMLLSCLPNKDIVKTYTYGYSVKQMDSDECVKARKTAEISGVYWKNIELGKYLQYIDEWIDLYGPAVHSHGMYQMEFYKKILSEEVNKGAGLLSGIIGDAWAGNVRIPCIDNCEGLQRLGYTHGECIAEDICLFPKENEIKEKFFKENKEKLQEENWRIVFAMRLKIMLLRYLIEIPRRVGLLPYSPFLDMDIALNILNLSWKEKMNREWQKKYFLEKTIEYGWLKKECDYNRVLDEYALRLTPLKPLNIDLLSKYIRKEYLVWINKYIGKMPLSYFRAKPKTLQNMLNKGIRKINSPIKKAFQAYQILRPLESVLLKKEGIRNEERCDD